MAKILRTVPSSSGNGSYEIRLGADARCYCTCPSWRFSKGSPKLCKHLSGFLSGTKVA